MRRRRLPRPLHAALCGLVLLLAALFLRLEYGPPAAEGEEAILRRMERQYLRAPAEPVAQWSDMSRQFFAVWDGSEIQVYLGIWNNGATFYGEERVPKPKPIVHLYRFGSLWRDSGVIGWGCPGLTISVWRTSEWVNSLPLLIKNDDPAAVRGSLTVSARDDSPEATIRQYVWHAASERENPWFFIFFVTPTERGNSPQQVLNAIQNVWTPGEDITAEAEIVWQDESGNELYRQTIDLIETEGGEA